MKRKAKMLSWTMKLRRRFFCARGGRAKSYQEKRASSYTLPRGACYDNSRKQEAARQGAGLPENYYEKE
ncbi:hypothetical protein D3Z48_11595 [Clostridiaceae bacterium]|nr:hypothetical protein [Clostridiaceae bacterium]